jgi:hypothetical protein
VSPILVRPVREQLEHDRLIRHLQAKYKRKFEVAINVGDEQVAPVKIGALTLYPDLVLSAGRKVVGVVEVESAESVNNLEAMAQWVHFSRSRVPFHLYVPVQVYEAARRLCDANQARVTETWTYRPAADGFDLVRMSTDAGAVRVSAAFATRPAPQKPVPEKPAAPPPKPVAPPKPVKPVKPRAAAKPARPAAKSSAKNGRPRGGHDRKPAARARGKAAPKRKR